MAELKLTPAFMRQYHEAGCEMEASCTTAKQVQSFSGVTKETGAKSRQSDEAAADLEDRTGVVRYDPDMSVDDILDEAGIAPAIGSIVLFFTFVVVSLAGVILSTFLALFSDFAFLHTLVAYYAVTNALILGTVVVFALLSTDYKEDTD